jgi:hypothetical protein
MTRPLFYIHLLQAHRAQWISHLSLQREHNLPLSCLCPSVVSLATVCSHAIGWSQSPPNEVAIAELLIYPLSHPNSDSSTLSACNDSHPQLLRHSLRRVYENTTKKTIHYLWFKIGRIQEPVQVILEVKSMLSHVILTRQPGRMKE